MASLSLRDRGFGTGSKLPALPESALSQTAKTSIVLIFDESSSQLLQVS